MILKINNTKAKEFTTFSLLGITNTAICFVLFTFFTHHLPEYDYRSGIAYSIATILTSMWSYYWNSRLTFKQNTLRPTKLLSFTLLQLTLSLLGGIALESTLSTTKINTHITWLIITALLTFVNFLLSSRFIFSHQEKSSTLEIGS